MIAGRVGHDQGVTVVRYFVAAGARRLAIFGGPGVQHLGPLPFRSDGVAGPANRVLGAIHAQRLLAMLGLSRRFDDKLIEDDRVPRRERFKMDFQPRPAGKAVFPREGMLSPCPRTGCNLYCAGDSGARLSGVQADIVILGP